MKERSADSSSVHVWLVLMKAHRSLLRHAERSIVSLDMCISDFGVLEVLLHKGPQSVSEIGRRVDLTSGSITTAIDRLEQRGLVARAAHASDRRARVVHLTPTGKTRITIYVDDTVIKRFKTQSEKTGKGYQTLINEALKAYLGLSEPPVTQELIRKIVREELAAHG